MIQIKGAVNFPISLDSTTWIFDDRKVTIDDLERGVFDGTRPIKQQLLNFIMTMMLSKYLLNYYHTYSSNSRKMANVYIVIMLLIVSYIFLKKDTLINLSMSHI